MYVLKIPKDLQLIRELIRSNSNLKQVKTWIIPAEFDHAEAESRHLIYEADTDADHKLTKNEILEKYDIFVGSQATDFGEALARHDEF